MAQTVLTQHGPGTIVATQTTRGRTEHQVEGDGFKIWVDAALIPPMPAPYEPGGDPNYQGDWKDTDPYAHGYDEDEEDFNEPAFRPGHEPDYQQQGQDWGRYQQQEQHNQDWQDQVRGKGRDQFGDLIEGSRHESWAPVDHEHSVRLPYNPRPQYPAIPGDGESTLQPIHNIDPDKRLHPSDSITFEDRAEDEGGRWPAPNPDLFAKHGGYQHDPTQGDYGGEGPAYSNGLQGDEEYNTESGYPEDERVQRRSDEGSGYNSYYANTRQANPLLLAPLLAEGAGAELGAGAAAEGAGAAGAEGAAAGGLKPPPGLGSALGGGDDEEGGENPDSDELIDALSIGGPGWGHLVKSQFNTDRMIELTSSADYYNNPLVQFAHDPDTFIERRASAYDVKPDPDMERYGMLVEADAQIREAAWRDVRQKAMRLRREGRVDVHDVAPDRIYATVKGDHGIYETMISKKGSFGGFGGGHTITNWRCSCKWGEWAFQRRYSYVGRLCSHGYAAYLAMQSEHMKGKPQGPRRKRADALQSVPQRLVPEMVVNDTDDTAQMLDVTKDERDTTGPDDILHFSSLMGHCDRTGSEYPRELVAFLERYADVPGPNDDHQDDWEIQDFSKANSDLKKIRNFADDDIEDDFGNLDDRNDAVRDAVTDAREHGVDADQLVASLRTAKPGEYDPRGEKLPENYTPGQVGGTTHAPVPGQSGGGGGGGFGLPGAAPLVPGWLSDVFRGDGNIGHQPSSGTEYNPTAPLPKGYQPGQVGDKPNPAPAPGGQAPAPGAPAPGGGWGGGKSTPSATELTQHGYGSGAAAGGRGGTGSGFGGAGQQSGGDWLKSNETTALGAGQYKAKPGDTLQGIADRAGVGVDTLKPPSGNKDMLGIGDEITIGTGGKPTGPGAPFVNTTTTPAAGAPASTGGPTKITTPSGGPAPATPPPAAATNPSIGTGAGGAGPVAQQPKPAVPAPTGGPAIPGDPNTRPRSQASFERQVLRAAGFTRRADDDAKTIDPNALPGGAKPPTAKPAAGAPAAPAAPASNVKTVGGPAAKPTKTVDNDPVHNPDDPAAQPGANAQRNPPGTGMGGMGLGGGGMGDLAGLGGGIANGLSSALPSITQALPGLASGLGGLGGGLGGALSGLASGIGHIFGATDHDDEDWRLAAFPEGPGQLPHNHPFEGSGPVEPLAFTDSKSNVKDNYSDNREDVTQDGQRTNPSAGGLEEYRTGGIRRKGRAPKAHVVPEVVREVVPNGQQRTGGIPDIPDPYSKTAADFRDDDEPDYGGQQMTASYDDPVAAFQNSQEGMQLLSANNGGGSQTEYDDFAGAASAHLKTAGRNFSLAEQSQLIHEGERGGAGNLDSLDLAGTHYEAENSVGLW